MQFTNALASAALAVCLFSNSVLGAALPTPGDSEISPLAKRNAACSFHLQYKTANKKDVMSWTIYSPDGQGPKVIGSVTTGSFDGEGVKVSVKPFGGRKEAKDLVAQYDGGKINFTFEGQAWDSENKWYCKLGKVDYGDYDLFNGNDPKKANRSMDCSFACGL